MGRWGEAVKKSGGSDIYLQLEDGTTRLRILSDPVVQNKTFANDPDNPRTIFSWIVWDYKTESLKLLSKGASILKSLDSVSAAWGDSIPMKCDVLIDKTGTGMQTKYSVQGVPTMPTHPLPADIQQQVEALDLDKLLPGNIPIGDFADGAQPESKSWDNSAVAPEKLDTVVEDVGDEPINLDDIPFNSDPSKSKNGSGTK